MRAGRTGQPALPTGGDATGARRTGNAPLLIQLALHPLPGDSLLLTLNVDGRAATSAQLAAPTAKALQPPTPPIPPVVFPGRDSGVCEAEARWSDRAAAALFSELGTARYFAGALGEAAGRGAPATLLVDAACESVARCPWELLSEAPGAPNLEAAGRAVVARLVGASAPPPAKPRHALRVLSWAPGRSDPSVEALERAQAERVRGWGTHLRLSDTLQELPPSRADTAELLHLICHGQRDLDRLLLMLGAEEGATTEDAACALGPLLRRSALVLLDVCHGGMEQDGGSGSLAKRLVLSGAAACCGGADEVDVDAARVFGDGLVRALRGGASVVVAAASGRRAVAALALAHPASRWHNHRLWVSSGAHATTALIEPVAWAPPGLPVNPAALAGLWSILKREVEAAGYLGLEPLVEALLSPAAFPDGAPTAVRDLLPIQPRSRAVLQRLALASAPRQAPSVTPRWSELFRAIPEGAAAPAPQVAALVRAILKAYGPPEDLHATPPQVSNRPSLLLEVVGGPEDGRRLTLEPGMLLSRWYDGLDPASAVGLYQGSGPVDRGVSRRGCLVLEHAGVLRATQARVRVARSYPAPPMTRDATLASRVPTRQLLVLEPGDTLAPQTGDEIWLSVSSATSTAASEPLTCVRVLSTPVGGNADAPAWDLP